MTNPGTHLPPRLVARGHEPQLIGSEGQSRKPRRCLDDQVRAVLADLAAGVGHSPASSRAVDKNREFRGARPRYSEVQTAVTVAADCGDRSISVHVLSDGRTVMYVATTHVLREQNVPNFVAVRQHHDPQRCDLLDAEARGHRRRWNRCVLP